MEGSQLTMLAKKPRLERLVHLRVNAIIVARLVTKLLHVALKRATPIKDKADTEAVEVDLPTATKAEVSVKSQENATIARNSVIGWRIVARKRQTKPIMQ
jgi:hypothetical protein